MTLQVIVGSCNSYLFFSFLFYRVIAFTGIMWLLAAVKAFQIEVWHDCYSILTTLEHRKLLKHGKPWRNVLVSLALEQAMESICVGSPTCYDYCRLLNCINFHPRTSYGVTCIAIFRWNSKFDFDHQNSHFAILSSCLLSYLLINKKSIHRTPFLTKHGNLKTGSSPVCSRRQTILGF